MQFWFLALVYLGQLAALIVRIKATGFQGTIRTMLVVENPAMPLGAEQLQMMVADRGAIVIPGFTITP